MMRDPMALLDYEAKRRPEIAALVARAETLTDHEIDTAQVPLPWYRAALRSLRSQKQSDAIASRMTALIETGVFDAVPAPEPTGETREWTGDRVYVRVERGGQVEMIPGELIFFPDAGGVWIGTIFSKDVDPRLLAGTHPRGHMTHADYRTARMEKANADCPADAPIMDLTTDSNCPPTARQTVAARYGVRFG